MSGQKFILLPSLRPLLSAKFNPSQRIHFPNPKVLVDKILSLRKAPQQIDVIADFDFTLTKHRYEGTRCDSVFGMWSSDTNLWLPQSFRNQIRNSYLTYGPFQTDSTISVAEKEQYVDTLYNQQTKLFEKYIITPTVASQVVNNSKMVFRSHTRELIELLSESEMCLYVISGGMSDVIYNSLAGIVGADLVDKTIRIFSNEWELINRQEVDCLRFRKDIVHSYNKYRKMANLESKRRHCLLMGDLKSDIYMARGAGYDTILSIFYGKEADTDQRELAERSFDVIVEGDNSHKIALELLKIIRKRVDPVLTELQSS